jgi:hypothetical protein
MRRLTWVVPLAIVLALAAVEWREMTRPADSQAFVRRLLWFDLQPVTLEGCTLERFGEDGDGGYLLCGNLLDGVTSGYSYGISGYDGWGCDVATRRQVPVHQYDCFNSTRPACDARTIFHEECIGPPGRTEGRSFDTLENQLARNGDATSRVVVKMDVEGAEWDALLTAPHEVLSRIDQLVVEFHGTSDRRYSVAVRRLKQYFHVANLHMNNHSCEPGREPFPAWAYEVLFVSRRLVTARADAPPRRPFDALDRPNKLGAPDCQPTAP